MMEAFFGYYIASGIISVFLINYYSEDDDKPNTALDVVALLLGFIILPIGLVSEIARQLKRKQ